MKPLFGTILTVTLLVSVQSLVAACARPCESRLLTTKGPEGDRLLVCGYLEGRRGLVVRASEFTVYRCADSRRLLEFGALQTADLVAVPGGLRVTEVANWPFGEHWQETYVAIREATLDGSDTITWKPRLERSHVSKKAVKEFIREYVATLQRKDPSYSPDEKVVAKLFAAAATGDSRATQLFRSMRKDVNLDGAAAEIYEIALQDQDNGTKKTVQTIGSTQQE